ncbi:5-deoxy-glucuronate isomerase [Glaciimonas immobilis]|uniref:5-deoxy-glucuronate isomerase n=1 Tax=Glaciimonas immobilis TaxID=728004 RepID=A0A840RNN8_9BURK|nr:5-deoxy-glucuronate isomerase [Glaciimonas immobilis]KAF3998875.1 5-deoxy-glucuronate isomerase [Glaciimonas immobilis]MBB5198270.1 5-deoxy-glucuronate isomerase [Glaciimonas immobilis]
MHLLVKGKPDGQEIVNVTPQSARWHYVGFAAYRLAQNQRLDFNTGAREICIVILRGIVSVRAGDAFWSEIGERQSVFDPISPYSVYVPHGQKVNVTAHGDAEIAVCSAPGHGDFAARLIEPASANRSVRGQGSNTRYVCDILPQSAPADHLLVVEVVTPAGHSSSYPPHKHDTDNLPEESALEETYYHRINPAQGFAFQRVYTDDRSLDESMAVENHDVVMVPRGYHPVVAPHGYDCYYLNVMAGPKRSWHFKNDPAHDWLMPR